MVMNNSFEEQLLKLISDTKSELAVKGEQKATIDREVEALKTEMQGYEITLRAYQKRSGIQGHNGIDWLKLMVGAKTHKDRDPTNNDPTNLRLLTPKEHQELHKRAGR